MNEFSGVHAPASVLQLVDSLKAHSVPEPILTKILSDLMVGQPVLCSELLEQFKELEDPACQSKFCVVLAYYIHFIQSCLQQTDAEYSIRWFEHLNAIGRSCVFETLEEETQRALLRALVTIKQRIQTLRTHCVEYRLMVRTVDFEHLNSPGIVIGGEKNSESQADAVSFCMLNGEGFGLSHRGFGPKTINEDTLFINRATHSFGIADGLGGYPHGQLIATTCAQFFAQTQWSDLFQAVSACKKELVALKNLSTRQAACCLSVAQLQSIPSNNGAVLNHLNIGDTRTIVMRESSSCFRYKVMTDSAEHSFETTIEDCIRKQFSSAQTSTALSQYFKVRHKVSETLNAMDKPLLKLSIESVMLEPGDWVIIASDGVFDNLSIYEISLILGFGDKSEGKLRSASASVRALYQVIRARQIAAQVSAYDAWFGLQYGASQRYGLEPQGCPLPNGWVQPGKIDNFSVIVFQCQ